VRMIVTMFISDKFKFKRTSILLNVRIHISKRLQTITKLSNLEA